MASHHCIRQSVLHYYCQLSSSDLSPPCAAELGRVASHYYIRHSSILVFNEHLKPHMTEADVLSMIAQSSGECPVPACCGMGMSRKQGRWPGGVQSWGGRLCCLALGRASER